MYGMSALVATQQIMRRWRSFNGDSGVGVVGASVAVWVAVVATIPWVSAFMAAVIIAAISTGRDGDGGGWTTPALEASFQGRSSCVSWP